MREKQEKGNINIREKMEEFNANSLRIKKYKPIILERGDKSNIVVGKERTNENTGEIYLIDKGYYGTLQYALSRLAKEVLKKDTNSFATYFEKYKKVKPEMCTKDIEKELVSDFETTIKLIKKELKNG